MRGGERSRAFQCASRMGYNEEIELRTMPIGVLRSTLNLIRNLDRKRPDGAWADPKHLLEKIIKEKETANEI